MSYEVIKELGSGGYGSVSEVRLSNGQRVAMKKYMQTRDAEEFLKKESGLLERMDSGLIPRLIEVHDDSFAMELVEGSILTSLHYAGIAPLEVAAIFVDVAEALEHAHAKGVLHRDLKPHNIMVRASDKRGMLIDFGLSEEMGSQIRTRVGTIGYTPPESLCQDSMTIEAKPTFDVYSFGCALAAAFAGRSPFRSDGMFATISNQENGSYEFTEEMPQALREVASACIAIEPHDRPQTMTEVLAMIQHARAALELTAAE